MSDQQLVPILHQILERLSLLEGQIASFKGSSNGTESAAPTVAVAAVAQALPVSVSAFDAYCNEKLNPFVAACNKLGGDAQPAGEVIREAWGELRKILLMSTACKEPSQAQVQGVLSQLSTKMKAAGPLVKRNEWEKHTKTVSEGIGCLNWVLVKPAPRDFIESFVGGSDYWANNIRKEFKATNPDQIAFCDTFKALLLGMMDYVKAHHATGLAWNSKGVDVNDYKEGGSAVAAAAPAATPAAAPAPAAATGGAAAPANPQANLFAALNKEGAVTAGLKKVTKDMQTWRAEYKDNAPAAPAPVAKAPVAPRANSNANQVKGPAKCEFQAGPSKWVVENQTDANGLVKIEIQDKKETVYVYGCVGATIEIVGKCKSIVVDTCKKTKIYFDTAMASCEIVNCARMQIHCRDTVPAVAIDKTDGIVVHLPRTSLHTEVVASKSSEMNLSWPDEEGELIEKPIPEQYVHRIKNGAITADVSDLYTH